MIYINSGDLSLAEIERILFANEALGISEKASDRLRNSHNFLQEFSKGKIIYGINTGFGPMAQYHIAEEDRVAMQYNLIRSHAAGMGSALEPLYVRASMLARLNTLCLGFSGVHHSAAEILLDFINHHINPQIFEHGGVGASGDLVQLAHLALAMIGEGKAHADGEVTAVADIMKTRKISPMQIKIREGLAVMNGTSVMTGIGIVNSIYAQRAISWSLQASVLICELINAYDDYFSEELNATKKHIGQRRVARTVKRQLESSQYIRKREQQLYSGSTEKPIFDDKIQEYYSIRCVPQIVGIILETVESCQKLLVEEINSANDNPIVHVEAQNVYHGGNFHGDYVSFEMDKLKMGMTKLSMLAERQINFLMNPALNGVLPPFVNLGKLALNFGMQGAQFTATSTTAENQALSTSMYIHSIPNNNDNQDIVSMGANAANMAKRVIENTFQVLAIEMVATAQAVDKLEKLEGLSPASRAAYHAVRNIMPSFQDDTSMSEKLEELKVYMMLHSPLAIES